MLTISAEITIPADEIGITFIRASGPGGQNVNKVSTAVQLHFDVAHSPSLPEGVRRRLLLLGGKRISADGVLVITARTHRTQAENRQEALQRLTALVRQAAIPPKHRRKTAVPAVERRQRQADKRQRAARKQARRQVSADFD
jgi:ribosome-associated protein